MRRLVQDRAVQAITAGCDVADREGTVVARLEDAGKGARRIAAESVEANLNLGIWRWRAANFGPEPDNILRATPIYVNGKLYTVAGIRRTVVCIEPTTGEEVGYRVSRFGLGGLVAILAGALILRSAAAFFPPGTVHVAVVDPGVGSARRAILIETQNAFFIGPDNGLLSLAAPAEAVQPV